MSPNIVWFLVVVALAGGCGTPGRRGSAPVAPTGVLRDEAPMAFVPAGPFLRGKKETSAGAKKGSPKIEDFPGHPKKDAAAPARTLYLDAFHIDKFEVTNGAYARFIEDTGRPAPRWSPQEPRWGGDWSRFSWGGRRPPPGAADLPVTLVTWFDAETYCAWAGKRLPSEAEWEKAARGTEGRIFPWGDVASPGKANYGKRHKGLLPGGSFSAGASPYGAMEMAGNAAEWVADYYDPTYYPRAPERNPRGPERGSLRVVRGGYWGQPEGMIRADRRWWGFPSHKHGGVGFRCAVSGSPSGGPRR